VVLVSVRWPKAWYIAYINNATRESIKLLSPANGELKSKADLYFSWKAEPGDLDEYTLVIANSAYIYNGTIICRQSVGKTRQTTLPEFQPERGKTYYWAVKGISEDGQFVFSDIGSFTINEEQPSEKPGLMALIYPNPAGNNDIHLAIDPAAEGTVLVRLMNLNGVVLAEKLEKSPDGLPMIVSLPDLELPAGIYFAVIRAGEEQVVRKVVVR
jgi:hypothetical protein